NVASIALRIFDRQCKKTFATISAQLGHRAMSDLSVQLARPASFLPDEIGFCPEDPAPRSPLTLDRWVQLARPASFCRTRELPAGSRQRAGGIDLAHSLVFLSAIPIAVM